MMSPFPARSITVFSEDRKPQKKTWEELTAAASTKTDPEELATILEEMLAALEERERAQSGVRSVSVLRH
jgi:hypothetical protein